VLWSWYDLVPGLCMNDIGLRGLVVVSSWTGREAIYYTLAEFEAVTLPGNETQFFHAWYQARHACGESSGK